MTLRGIEVHLEKFTGTPDGIGYLVFSAGADYVDYDDDIQKVNLEMIQLREKGLNW